MFPIKSNGEKMEYSPPKIGRKSFFINRFELNSDASWRVFEYSIVCEPALLTTIPDPIRLEVEYRIDICHSEGNRIFSRRAEVPEDVKTFPYVAHPSLPPILVRIVPLGPVDTASLLFTHIRQITLDKVMSAAGFRKYDNFYMDAYSSPLDLETVDVKVWRGYELKLESTEGKLFCTVNDRVRLVRGGSLAKAMDLMRCADAGCYDRLAIVKEFKGKYVATLGEEQCIEEIYVIDKIVFEGPAGLDTATVICGSKVLSPEDVSLVGMHQDDILDDNFRETMEGIFFPTPNAIRNRIYSLFANLQAATDEIYKWGLQPSFECKTFPAYKLPIQTVVMKNGEETKFYHSNQMIWLEQLQEHKMYLSNYEVDNWAIFFAGTSERVQRMFIDNFAEAGTALGIHLGKRRPSLHAINIHKLTEEVKRAMTHWRTKPGRIFIVLPPRDMDALTKLLDYLISDCNIITHYVLTHNAVPGKIRLACQHALARIVFKKDCIPWYVNVELEDTLIVGLDATEDETKFAKIHVTAVASTNEFGDHWYSTSETIFTDGDEFMFSGLRDCVQRCIGAYVHRNGKSPHHAMIFGTPSCKLRSQEQSLRMKLKNMGENQNILFTIVTVNQQTGLKVFVKDLYDPDNTWSNVPSGTGLYDQESGMFYLVSAAVKGHRSEAGSYEVLSDDKELEGEDLLKIFYKLCYLYYPLYRVINRPAVLQYAQDMAENVSIGIRGPPLDIEDSYLWFI